MATARGDRRWGLSRPGDPRGRSFGDTAAEYERYRPGYPAAAVRWLLEPVGPGATVVDVGAGTGKLTRVVVAEGHRVTAVDPDTGMLGELRRVLPGVPAVEGTGESLPVAEAGADAVLVAQAWHWMEHEAAAAEFARVVRPGGVVGLVWNVRDTTDPLAADLTRLTSAIDLADAGRDGPMTLPHPAFADGETTSVDNSVDLTVDDLVSLVGTWSYVARGPEPQAVLARVRALAERHVRPGGTVRYAMRTRCHRFRRIRPRGA